MAFSTIRSPDSLHVVVPSRGKRRCWPLPPSRRVPGLEGVLWRWALITSGSSDEAGFVDLAHDALHVGRAAGLLPDLKDRVGLAGGVQHEFDLVRRYGERLLARDMFASLECRSGHLRVQVARRGDENGVDILLAKQLPVVGVGTRIVGLGGALRGISGGRIDVANGPDRDVGPFDQAGQVGVCPACRRRSFRSAMGRLGRARRLLPPLRPPPAVDRRRTNVLVLIDALP